MSGSVLRFPVPERSRVCRFHLGQTQMPTERHENDLREDLISSR
jgi:hypothetical protein